ncbi:MAG TPA: aspartyl protease family protein [Kofleriaceae bacterium]|nr:aspartyl protease family protein [Kofleriaceae bacterium]
MPRAENRVEVLARARAALRAPGAPGAPSEGHAAEPGDSAPILARGRGDARGVPVTWTRAYDGAGRVVDTAVGALGHASGFDGERGWRVDETGMLGPLELGDLEELIVVTAVFSGAWCREGGPVTVLDAVIPDSARVWLSLRAAGGLRRFRLAVDARTGLASRLERAGRDDAALELGDYRPGPSGLVPHLLVWREGWLTDTLRVEALGPAPGPVDFGPASAAPADTAFDLAAALEQRSSRTRLPLVRASIDGHDAGWFALDTGASACAIEAAVAARLGLPELGRRFVRTADGAAGAPYRRAGALRVGAATLRAPLLLELELQPFARAAGIALGGVLGYDLFMRAVVELGGPSGIAIAPPGAAAGEAGDDWLPLRFEDGLPVVAARYPGPDGPREGLFAIDTGSAIAVTITAGAAPSFALRGGARAALRGAGGAVSATAASLPWLEFAGHRLEDVSVLAARPGAGALGEPEPAAVVGLIGMGLLRHFAVTFDYPRRRLRARPLTADTAGSSRGAGRAPRPGPR